METSYVVLFALVFAAVIATMIVWTVSRPTKKRSKESPCGVYAPVKVATDKHLDISDVDEIPREIDGVHIESGDRILLLGQNMAHQNGIYTINEKKNRITRAKDLKEDDQAIVGSTVLVESGQTYGGSTLTLQVQKGAGVSFMGIQNGLQFIRLVDEILGDINRREGSLLVSNSQSPYGVGWSTLEELVVPSSQSPDTLWDEIIRCTPDRSVYVPVEDKTKLVGAKYIVVRADNNEALVCRVLPGPLIADTTSYGDTIQSINVSFTPKGGLKVQNLSDNDEVLVRCLEVHYS